MYLNTFYINQNHNVTLHLVNLEKDPILFYFIYIRLILFIYSP